MTLRSSSTALAAVLAGAIAFVGCSPERQAAPCHRLDVPSMGPENGLRTRVAIDPARVVSAPDGRVDVALTAVPASAGPVLLVHTRGDKELGRWQIAPPPSNGVVSRCTLGFAPAASTCGANLVGPSHPLNGEWSIEPGDRQILEASVSFRLCD